ncbi:glycosyltransferase family 2 protein [Enterobacter sp.]|uniref:glycosyltransferase family 2 protein n=1 Tax=Enterobacter sp. TaxID=42895 RepID=UPI00296EDD8A|nr:glycosyltransferase family 2 protein [Enterobacter sp.]
MKKVSIIIPAYNSSNYLDDALRSVVIQALSLYEIIVVDDGSTEQEHRAYVEICNRYPHTELIVKPNGGAASARNVGAAKASGELLAFLDCDDTWLANKLSSQIEIMHAKDADLVLGNILVTDESLNVKYKASKKISEDKETLIKDLYYGKVIMNTPTILITKEAFFRVKGFDENLKYREDHSFLIDIANDGRIVLDSAYRTLRRERTGSLSSVAGIEVELAKHMPFWLKNEAKFSFLEMKKARAKLLSRLFIFYVRNNRKAEVENTLAYLKNDAPIEFVFYKLLSKLSYVLAMLYLLRNKMRNALL